MYGFFALLLVAFTAALDDRLLVRLFPNGEDRGQSLWLSRSVHFPTIRTFQRLMQSIVENGASNGGYNRPLEFEAKVYRHDGALVQRWEDILEGDSLYVVPYDAMFMWPGVAIGHKVNVSQTLFPEYSGQIELETLSVSPRIFRIRRLIEAVECETLIELNRHNMTRSAVGKVDNYDQKESPKTNRRTSTNSFDVSSPVARAIIDRIFYLLRIAGRDAIEDGLQVVRYAQDEAYDVHTDFFPVGYSPDTGMNFDPSTGGSNRYATVFAFLTDDFQGGETVFPHVPKAGAATCAPMDISDTDTNWTETMTRGMCTHSLAVTPVRGDAVLFYSTKPNGRMDPLTEHGGCPVINGTKFGANLWVWNRGKYGSHTRYEVSFVNELDVPVQLYFFHAKHNPPLTLMTTIPAQQSSTFLASRGDEFAAHTGTEWVGKFVVLESHHKHKAFRIADPKIEIVNSFEYHIGFGAGLRAGHEQAVAAIQTESQSTELPPT